MRLEGWFEVYESLGRHRFRTTVTAASVAWGIFMLVVLLSVGRGLENNVGYRFRDDATNSIWIYEGETSVAHEGHRVGRSIRFDNADIDAIRGQVPGIEHLTGRFYPWMVSISTGSKSASFSVRAVHPGHQYIENTLVTHGRFLSDRDVQDRRKVAVIGKEVERFFFPGSAIGERVHINHTPFLVVGVFDDVGGVGEQKQIYIPITTGQMTFGGAGGRVQQIMFSVGDAGLEESERIGEQVKRLLARRHNFAPDDRSAIRLRNNLKRYAQVADVMGYLRLFVWLVGMGTVAAGIVATSNIMLVAVAERTREIGLRKALGATPGSIITMILRETFLLTGGAGYLGLVAGVGLVEGVSRLVPENEYIRDPSVDLGVLFGALVLTTLAGLLAGFFPARRAARVRPIVALRDE